MIDHATALGNSRIAYSGGTLAYGAEITTDISSVLNVEAETGVVAEEEGVNDVTLAMHLGKNLTLSNSAYDAADPDSTGSLTYNFALNGSALDLEDASIVKNNLAHGLAFSLTGGLSGAFCRHREYAHRRAYRFHWKHLREWQHALRAQPLGQ